MPVATPTHPIAAVDARDRAELILAQIDRLPTLPVVAARLLAVTSSDESSFRHIVELVEADATLTAAVLRSLRRADHGANSDVTTVARAVGLLGFDAVRNLVLSVTAFQTFAGQSDPPSDDADDYRNELWRHNIAVAAAAEMLAEAADGSVRGSEAFVCGLLHDIGKIALDASVPKTYARVVERVRRDHECICDAERELLGLDHTVAGKHLLQRWQLPRAMVDCAWLHHQHADALPASLSNTPLVRIVHLADSLVRQCGIGFSGYNGVTGVSDLAAQLGIHEQALSDTVAQLPERIEPLIAALGLDAVPLETLSVEGLLEANRRLGEINATLTESNRRLRTRSRFFDEIQRFHQRLATADRPSDVCAAAAAVVRRLLDGDAAMAYYADGIGRHLFAANCSGRSDEAAVSLHERADGADWAAALSRGNDDAARGLARADERHAILWRQCGAPPGETPLWLLPLRFDDPIRGGVLVRADECAIEPLRASLEECEALAASISMALTAAEERSGAERMNEELADLNRRLRIAQKELLQRRSIAMVAEMAAGAAHELNNPLSVISGRAQMELRRTTDADLAAGLQIVVDQTHRAAEIVTDLMGFAKPPEPQPLTRSVAEMFETLRQHWQTRFALRGDQLRVSVADPDVTVFADLAQLDEVLTALVANAAQAFEGRAGRIQVNSPSGASDETTRIVIEDDGVGMSREVLEHAIDPFYSHRPAGRGRGLGLSRAYRLVEANHGRTWIESRPGVGTTVTVDLPARDPAST